jgi:UDP-GlcNAc:undecaprenyl-phosphate GlcNAc-1-phosphate transferase
MPIFDGLEPGPWPFTALAAAGSLIAGAAAYLLAGAAGRVGLVSRHRLDRFGARRVPLTGGPGLLLGVAVPLALLGIPLAPGQIVAAGGLFAVGLLDDFLELSPAPKFALQGVVALAAAFLLVPPVHAAFVAVVLLLLVNASNYLDNMDALLPGVALTQAVGLLLFGAGPGLYGAPLLVWTLPALVFLTAPPARVYLGDSGSHLVGALLALDVTALVFGPEGVQARALAPLAVLFAVPLLDVAVVTISRLRRRRPLFRGGIDHLSHRLVRRGFPVPKAVLILVLASGTCGVAALLLRHIP